MLALPIQRVRLCAAGAVAAFQDGAAAVGGQELGHSHGLQFLICRQAAVQLDRNLFLSPGYHSRHSHRPKPASQDGARRWRPATPDFMQTAYQVVNSMVNIHLVINKTNAVGQMVVRNIMAISAPGSRTGRGGIIRSRLYMAAIIPVKLYIQGFGENILIRYCQAKRVRKKGKGFRADGCSGGQMPRDCARNSGGTGRLP